MHSKLGYAMDDLFTALNALKANLYEKELA